MSILDNLKILVCITHKINILGWKHLQTTTTGSHEHSYATSCTFLLKTDNEHVLQRKDQAHGRWQLLLPLPEKAILSRSTFLHGPDLVDAGVWEPLCKTSYCTSVWSHLTDVVYKQNNEDYNKYLPSNGCTQKDCNNYAVHEKNKFSTIAKLKNWYFLKGSVGVWTSSNFSKFRVSSSSLTSGLKAASMSYNLSQGVPLNHGWFCDSLNNINYNNWNKVTACPNKDKRNPDNMLCTFNNLLYQLSLLWLLSRIYHNICNKLPI